MDGRKNLFLPGHLIRPYQAGDEEWLATMAGCWLDQRSPSPQHISNRFERIVEKGGWVWIYCLDEEPIGYALLIPVPGLPHVIELAGCIAPRYRRKGLGTRMLDHIVAHLGTQPITHISQGFDSLDKPAAHFLKSYGFVLEHEEWRMVRFLAFDRSIGLFPPDYSIRNLDPDEAAPLFRQLYQEAFSGLAWYQPYLSDDEVLEELDAGSNLLFLWHLKAPIGFAWLRAIYPGRGEIEPIGLLHRYRGQGLGRKLMEQAMNRLAQAGNLEVQVGVWTANRVALDLYRVLGFQRESSTYYLACDLKSKL